MNYELALKLKEAGFPLRNNEWRESVLPNKYILCSEDLLRIYLPTLSELTAECLVKQPTKYSNFTLNHTFVEACGGSGYLWEAYFDGGIDGKNQFYETDETPEEAVANLWLKLNNK